MKNCFIDNWLLKKVLAESPYALLYVQEEEEGRLGLPLIVKAETGNSPRNLICNAEDFNAVENHEGRFKVVLRFINKRKGNFIRLQGIASVNGIGKKSKANQDSQSCQQTSITLEVVQIAWLYKQTGKVDFFI